MQHQDTFKQNTFSNIVVLLTMIFDGLSMAIFGFVYLIGRGNTDFVDLEIKKALMRQGELVTVLAFVYLLFCILSLSLWSANSRLWGYIVLSLGMIHFIGASYLLVFDSSSADSVLPLPYVSIVVNVLLLVIIVKGKNRLKLLSRNSNM